MLKLARLYVLDPTAPQDRSFRLLQDLIVTAREPAVLAGAWLALGEYYLRREDPTAAAEAFLDAALVEGADPELRAEAILQAAKAESEAGRFEAARALAQRVLDNFPESRWAGAARAMAVKE